MRVGPEDLPGDEDEEAANMAVWREVKEKVVERRRTRIVLNAPLLLCGFVVILNFVLSFAPLVTEMEWAENVKSGSWGLNHAKLLGTATMVVQQLSFQCERVGCLSCAP